MTKNSQPAKKEGMDRPFVNAHAVIRLIDRHGWSYSETARRIGMSPSHFNDLVNGKVERPRRSTMRKLAEILGVAEHALYLARGPGHMASVECTAEEMECLGLFRAATPGGREKILIFARGVVAGATAVEIGAAQNLHEKLGQESERAKRPG